MILGQDFSPSSSVPLSVYFHHCCIFIYHLEDEQQASWKPQFRHIVSPSQHDMGQTYSVISGPLKGMSVKRTIIQERPVE
jgi:hypothetical protein